jgi:hypothetical protein
MKATALAHASVQPLAPARLAFVLKVEVERQADVSENAAEDRPDERLLCAGIC